MKKIIFPLALLGAAFAANAQVKVGDNPTTINSNAVFEVESATKGILLPRVALTGTASPAPLSAFTAGMTVYNTATAGSGTTAVTPGMYYSDGTKWVPLGKDWAEDQSLGSIAVFPFASVPSTYLVCNGQAVSRTTYAALFAKIGTTYGAGDGSTTFNLPDLRGEFIRGWDNGRGVDTGRVLGSAQADALKAHNHQQGSESLYNLFGGGSFVGQRTWGGNTSYNAYTGQNTSTTGDSETRPRNVAMVYAIKAEESIIVAGSGSGSGTTYTGSTSVALNGSSFERAALTGDVTAPANSNATTIANNAVNSAKIADGAVATADLADNAVTSAKIVDGTVTSADLATGIGGIYKGSGSLSANTAVTMGTNTLAFPSTATTGTSHFTIDDTTLNVDAVNNRVGIGTTAPGSTLTVGSTDGTRAGELRLNPSNTTTEGGQVILAKDLTYGTKDYVIDQWGGNGTASQPARMRIFASGGSFESIVVNENGNVGMGGTVAPTTPLQVNGAVRVGTSSQTAAAAGAGAIRYNTTTGALEYSNGTSWNLASIPASGSVLRVSFPTATQSSNTSTSITFTVNYTPVSSNSIILVEVDTDYFFGNGTNTGTGSDIFESRLNIDGLMVMRKYQRFNASAAGGGSRGATLLPIRGTRSNTSTTTKSITIVLERTSGDDLITANLPIVKITEIQN
jgi:hypothetical protein